MTIVKIFGNSNNDDLQYVTLSYLFRKFTDSKDGFKFFFFFHQVLVPVYLDSQGLIAGNNYYPLYKVVLLLI